MRVQRRGEEKWSSEEKRGMNRVEKREQKRGEDERGGKPVNSTAAYDIL